MDNEHADIKEKAAKTLEIETEDIVSIEESIKCPVCSEQFYRIELAEDIEVESCDICGDPQCLEVNDYGQRAHIEYLCEDYFTTYNDIEPLMCYGCYESFSSRPAGTLSLITPEGVFTGQFEENILMHFNHENLHVDELSSDEYEAIESMVKSMGYHRTDGWRGYHSFDVPSGWVNVLSGWHSSMESSKVSEFLNDLEPGTLDYPVIKAFTTGSNVCSLGINLLVPEEHADALRKKVNGLSAFGTRPT